MAKQIKKAAKHLRLALVDDEIHEEIRSIKFNKTIAILLVVSASVILCVLTYFVTSRTPLKYTIPGYPTAETKAISIETMMKVDSLERIVKMWEFQVSNIQRVVTGRKPLEIDSARVAASEDAVAGETLHSLEDSLLREQVLNEEQFSLSSVKKELTQIEGLHFCPPVKGMITEHFSATHPFVDIAVTTGTTVCATLKGTVISAVWNEDTGYTIQIQHSNDLISVYKHNEKLFNKMGDKVKEGTPIALSGNSGSLTTGPHLHFELWHKGEAIDPEQYINF